MRIFKHGEHRLFETEPETAQVVSDMLLDLEKNGMDAVRKYSRKFDDWDPDDFELSEKQIDEAVSKLDEQIVEDTDFCRGNIQQFAEAQLETLKPLEVEIRPEVILGHKHIPVKSVGSYTPGGRYPMFGSALMSIIPAKVAAVDNVYGFTPPVKGEGYYPATVNAMKIAGADRIFILGGVQAFAMMAFGMGVFDPVDILCGAGNKYITEAKRQLFGRCGIDLLAGPTEILIIADNSADPSLVACDLLGQAEHDPNSRVALICFSRKFAEKCSQELERQLEKLPTKDVAELSWNNNGIIYIADHRDEAISISDSYAPEHLELHVREPDYYLDNLRNYGSLFIGEETTVAYGDKCIGTNHILPTSRAARYTGGLWVGKFLKTVTYQRMTGKASRLIGEVTERQCEAEKMFAHAITAKVRVERYKER
jgi:sulfopropanediol 3-dehydrogenase